jgi:hypothetical protein
VISRAIWWVLLLATASLAAYQVYLGVMYATSSNWEAVAAIALFGLWGSIAVVPLLALTGWRWQSLGRAHRQLGLGLPLFVLVLTTAGFVAGP